MSARDNLSCKPCCFCNLAEDNELEYGKMYEHNGIVTHYYCLLLSSNMEQKGSDEEGILGFLTEDIQKELRRGKRLVCSYCRKIGATLGCCNVRCKRIFHFPCGLKTGSLHQFFGEFRSFCINHRPKQKIDDIVNQSSSLDNVLCYICYDKVNPTDVATLWAPCCKKDAWFHRKCVQQLALSAGYFFKCPLCNNKKIFQEAMLEYGIFVPSQDASWELVPNAFEELLYRHDQCDAARCLCPKGRKHTSSNAKWELILCRTCGSQGIHMACGQLKWANPVWECAECTSILNNAKDNTNAESDNSSDGSSQSRDSDSDSDSDTDISVGTDFPMLCTSPNLSPNRSFIPPHTDSAIRMRPGPRSFKLQQQVEAEKIKCKSELTQNALDKNVTTEVNSEDTKKLLKDDDGEKESLMSEENISQQKDKENNSEEKKQSCSNDEKSRPIRKETDVITIESDDDDDDIEIIALKKRTDTKSISQSALQPNAPNVSFSNAITSLLGAVENSETSKSLSATSTDLMKDDNINLKKSIVSESKIPKKNESTTLGKFDVATSQESPHPLVLNGHGLEDINASDTSEDSVMNIKITNVTSLPPEEFDSVPSIACENVTLHKDSFNIYNNNSSSTSKILEENIITHVSPPKRSMCEEANGVADNCKKIKGNNFDCDIVCVSRNISRQQNEISSILNEMRKDNKNPSTCTSVSVKEISNLNNSQKNNLSTQFTSFCKTNDTSQVSSNHSRENGVFLIQNNGDLSTKLKLPTVERGNSIYIRIPSLRRSRCFGKAEDTIFTTNQNAGNNRNMCHAVATPSDVPTSQATIIPVLNYHPPTILASQLTPNTASVIVNGREELNKQKVTKNATNEKLTIFNPGNSSSNNVRCDGDAGTSPATDSTGRRKKGISDESCGSVDGDDDDVVDSDNSSATHSVFPQVTNNHNTCHQPRLIPQYMNLRDLKFRVHESDNIQMILYDTFSVNIPTNSKEPKIRLTGLAAPRESKESSTLTSRVRGEASSSLDHDNLNAERFNKFSHSSKNETYLINDKTRYISHGHDDTKENLDPESKISQRGSTIDNINLANVGDVDDTMTISDYVCSENDGETRLVSNDTNLNTLNRPIYSTNVVNVAVDGVASVPNNCNQSSRIDLESAQQYKQEEKTGGARTFCKEINRTVHNVDFDLNVVNTNRNVEKILRNDITVFSQHIDDRGIGNDCTENSPMLWNGYKYLDNTNVMRPKVHNRSVSRVSNITFNERSILNKQIDACDSGKFIRCMAFHENNINRNSENSSGYNSESCIKVSIDLCKVQNLIDSKPELFVSQERNADNQWHKCTNRLRDRDDHTRQQVRYCNIENSDSIRHNPPKNKELQLSNCTNSIEQTQIRDTFTGANTFVRQKPKREIRYFDKRILDR